MKTFSQKERSIKKRGLLPTGKLFFTNIILFKFYSENLFCA